MPITDAIVLYLAVASSIYVVFERVEKVSSKSDLDLYYLVITVKRENIANVLPEGILRFFDRVFGRGLRVGTLTMPRFRQVVLFTALVHLVVYFLLLRSVPLSIYGSAPLLPLLTSFLVCVPFDFVSFAKTRFIMETAARVGNAYYWALLFLTDVVCSALLAVATIFSFLVVFFGLVISIAERYPAISSTIFRIKVETDPNGSINWEHTFEAVTDTGNLVVNALMDMASLSLSSSTVCIFVLSLVCARLMRKLSVVQDFLDKHTAVQDKPLQVIGVISIVIFSVVFWVSYIVSRIV